MLTAGDEFGRTQAGNNNAYAQDNPITWLDWEGRDRDLEAHAAALAALRRAHPALADPTLLTGAAGADGIPDVAWLTPGGTPRPSPTGRTPTRPASPCCSAPAATAASPCSSTAAATRSPSTCRPAPATTGPTPRRPDHRRPPRRRLRRRAARRTAAEAASQSREPPLMTRRRAP